MISIAESEPTFIKGVVGGDEMWVYEYNTQSQLQFDRIFPGLTLSRNIISVVYKEKKQIVF